MSAAQPPGSTPALTENTDPRVAHPAVNGHTLPIELPALLDGSIGTGNLELQFGGQYRRQHRRTSVRQAARSGIEALAANIGRALLTALGVIIGVAAVVVMISIGTSASGQITQTLSALGTNVLIVSPGTATGTLGGGVPVQTLTETDALAIGKLPNVTTFSPIIYGAVPVSYGRFGWTTRVEGAFPSIQSIQNLQLAQGGFFTDEDETAARPVCVLGLTVVRNLFQQPGDVVNPVGQQVQIRNLSCTVIGVLVARGSTSFIDQDDLIIMPYLTAQGRLFGKTYVDLVMVQGSGAGVLTELTSSINDLIRTRHRLNTTDQTDVQIRSDNQVQDTLKKTTGALTILLSGIAAVSLIVGGIGIMNIMLVSVTERTREIGIRMSVGARRGDVMAQFLLEAILISGGGGIAGLLFGAFVSVLATTAAGWGAFVDAKGMLLAFLFSVAVGIFFGYYPARKASQLDPIEALRRD